MLIRVDRREGSKTKWRFSARDGPWMCLTGLWDRCATANAGQVLSFSIVNQSAAAPLNGDRDRTPVVARRES